ncbi:MAG: hypothetical protein NC933_01015, partial [Candidatus Omnitrophica bacterium]|nr:hypothetical protein [Candidatus Omnitrophota bacterium]
ALFVYAYNIGEISPEALLAPLSVCVGATSIAYIFLSIFIRDNDRVALLLTLFLIFFFSYGSIYPLLKASPLGAAMTRFDPRPGIILLATWALIFIIDAFLIMKIRESLKKATAVLNAVSAVLVLAAALGIGFYDITRAVSQPKIASHDKMDERKGYTEFKPPDIYYIIVDAYARGDILKKVYDYDNSAFLSSLEKKGFYVAGDSASNYARTSLSLSSSLNMDYLDKIITNLNAESKDIGPLKNLIKHSRVFRFLRRQGYKIAAFSSGCFDTEIDNADIYMRPGWEPDEFQNTLISLTPLPVIFDFIGIYDQFDAHRGRILFILNNLAKVKDTTSPLFVFAHIYAPHPPFVFDRNGKPIKLEPVFQVHDGDWLVRDGRLTRQEYIKHYVDQLVFISKKLDKTLSVILSRPGTPPIIVVQSDHGPRSGLHWESPMETDFAECMSILNAYHLPDGGDALLYEDISPVNTFRTIFNYYFGTEYPILEDRSFLSTARYPYKFIEVTEMLRK